jgi:hypothetical protein
MSEIAYYRHKPTRYGKVIASACRAWPPLDNWLQQISDPVSSIFETIK